MSDDGEGTGGVVLMTAIIRERERENVTGNKMS